MVKKVCPRLSDYCLNFYPNSTLNNQFPKEQFVRAFSILDGLRVSRRGRLLVGGDDDVTPRGGDSASFVQIVKAGVHAVWFIRATVK